MENNIVKRKAWNSGLTKSDPRVQKMYKNRNPWNKGLTKQTDERVNQNAMSIQRAWTPENITRRTASYRKNMMLTHGVCNTFQLESTKEKSKATFIHKYGVDNFAKTDEYITKTKQTKMEKYGDENYTNPEKNKKTCLERYGVSNPNKIKDVRDKIKTTNIKNYGVEYPCQNELIKQKVKTTCYEKYGVSSVMHLPEFVEKQRINSYKSKKYTLPSGKIISCQGYEPMALDVLLEDYNECDIITERTEIPKFWYITPDNKKHIYYPDIFIKPTNTIVEIKSTWTAILHPIIDKLKEQSVMNDGYRFQKMIFNAKGNLLETYARNK